VSLQHFKKKRKFEGFYFQKRSLRDYEVDFGANVFGFITVNERLIAKTLTIIAVI
jgi:penicillin-binding protein 2